MAAVAEEEGGESGKVRRGSGKREGKETLKRNSKSSAL